MLATGVIIGRVAHPALGGQFTTRDTPALRTGSFAPEVTLDTIDELNHARRPENLLDQALQVGLSRAFLVTIQMPALPAGTFGPN